MLRVMQQTAPFKVAADPRVEHKKKKKKGYTLAEGKGEKPAQTPYRTTTAWGG